MMKKHFVPKPISFCHVPSRNFYQKLIKNKNYISWARRVLLNQIVLGPSHEVETSIKGWDQHSWGSAWQKHFVKKFWEAWCHTKELSKECVCTIVYSTFHLLPPRKFSPERPFTMLRTWSNLVSHWLCRL